MNHNLTRREWQVLRLVAERLSNKEIGRKLHVSIHTVKNHVHNIIDKLHATDRIDAVHIGLGIKLSDETRCDACPIAAKAAVIAADLQKLADELKG